MDDVPRISEAEWDVMEVLWDRSPLSATEVAEALAERRDWSPTTIKTMLARLVRKGALETAQDGRRYLYSPAVTRETCRAAATETFVERVMGGSASPLLAWFVEQERLDADELDELRRLIDEAPPSKRRKR